MSLVLHIKSWLYIYIKCVSSLLIKKILNVICYFILQILKRQEKTNKQTKQALYR